ncbi:MAG TPA: YciI family protein [Blastocatellia bacterium]|nr:YciI family protein [Blastocatellia bacterium]
MPQYILLLHEAPSDFSNVSPEEMQQIIGEYTAWRRKIEAEGKYAGGNKLKDEGGRHVSTRNGKARVVDGPYAEAKEVMGGYFIITADNYDEAVETSKDCPHLKYNGWIEVREIDPVG